MKKINVLTVLSALILSFTGCYSAKMNSREYKAKINKWHHQRVKNLTHKGGWLTLAGLFWLHPGRNSFGSDTSNDFIFPKDKFPAHIGAFTLQILLNNEWIIRISHLEIIINQQKNYFDE
jgi:hypothetical protein